MANICISNVTFYSESGKLDGIQKLKQDIEQWLEKCNTIYDRGFESFFDYIALSKSNIDLRCCVIEADIQEYFLSLECECSWIPSKDAYDAISKFYEVNYVFIAEELGGSLFYNTDNEGDFYNYRYKIIICNQEEQSLKDLIANTGGDVEFYFSSEKKVYQWLKENGGITISTIEELEDLFDIDTLAIMKFINPYE